MGDIPLSIQMIRVQNKQVEDTNDPATLLQHCEMAFSDCERTYFEIFNLAEFQGKMHSFKQEIMRKIPLHV
jgi:hypothetical protein